MNPYADTKVLWHTGKIDSLRRGEQITPLHVQLIISDLCNEDCSFCAYRMSGYTTNQLWGDARNPQRMIVYPKACEILDNFSAMGVKAVQFTGGGEPTVHPRHMDLFRRALNHGLECGLVSNGVLIDKHEGWEDVYGRFTWIRISLDSATEANYAKIRNTPEANFGKAVRNLRALASRASSPLLGVGFIVLRENVHELLDAAALAKDCGAAYIRIGAFFSSDNERYYGGWHEKIRELIDEARQRYQDDAFRVVDLFGQRVDDLTQQAPDYDFCGFQFFTTYIGADLNVYRCCNTSYNKRGFIGSLVSQSFKDMWRSEEAKRSMFEFNARGCERCQFNGKNRLLNAVLNEPTHPNFT